METTVTKTQAAPPDLFGWLESIKAEIVAAMAGRAKPDCPVSAKIGALMEQACNGGEEASLETLFSYIATGNGLHAAAQEALALGDSDWSAALHGLGEVFATYAAGHLNGIAEIARQNAAEIEAERARGMKAAGTIH